MKCKKICFFIVCILAISSGYSGWSIEHNSELLHPKEIASTTTLPPSTEDVEVCANLTIPSLNVSGTNIKWYSSASSSNLYDSRDGQTYQTVLIGDQIWMAENLNYGNRINSILSASNNGTVEKYCLDNNESKCSTYGGLYQWNEVMNYSTIPESQGICPSGWHIPSNEEWKRLEIALGMNPTEADQLGARGTTEGTELQLNGGSGFEALMAGKREIDGSFASEGNFTTFWASTENFTRTLSIGWDHVALFNYDEKEKGFSVRCIKNETSAIATGNTYNTGQTQPGTYIYYVSQTINGVESDRVPISLTIHPSSQVNISGDTHACEGKIITLDAGSGYSSYQWNTNSTSRQIQVSANGTYDVTVTDVNGCEATDQRYIEFHPNPTVSITGDNLSCLGEAVDLDAGVGYNSYQWSTNSSSRQIQVSNSGTYSVTVTDINGCEGVDDHYIEFRALPNVSIIGDTEACEGDMLELDAGPGYAHYLWNTNEISRKITVSSSGTYSVSITDAFGCQNSDDIVVSFTNCIQNNKPEIDDQIFSVSENEVHGAVVGQIQSFDKDSDQLLSYWVLSGNENFIFDIDRQTGWITVNNSEHLNYEENPQIQLQVKVRDNGIGLLSDSAMIMVNILDVNEPPKVQNQVFVIDENLPKDTWIGTISAEDEDNGQNLSFEILFGNDDDAFNLDPYLGGLFINNPDAIDFEKNPEFQLSIRVSDDAPDQLYTNSIVEIRLNNLAETNITERVLSKIQIYPNPSYGKVYLELDDFNEDDIMLSIYDSKGSKMKNAVAGNESLKSNSRLEINFHNSGVYFIKLQSSKEVRIEKVICY